MSPPGIMAAAPDAGGTRSLLPSVYVHSGRSLEGTTNTTGPATDMTAVASRCSLLASQLKNTGGTVEVDGGPITESAEQNME